MSDRDLPFDTLVEFVRQRLPGVRAVYGFGSAACGRARPDSDIDIAVLGDAPLTSEARFELEQACTLRLRTDVDLVDLRAAPLTLQAGIVGEGRLLFAVDRVETAFFENAIMSRYCAFNEERRALLDAIAARGTIHA